MSKWLFTVATSVLVLTACASVGQQLYSLERPRLEGYKLASSLFTLAGKAASATAPNPTAPNVFITGSQKRPRIIVDQEPIRPPGDNEGDQITIYWGLDDSDGDKAQYIWKDDDAIKIKATTAPKQLRCSKQTDFVFLCKYLRPTPDTEYKYAIRVWDKKAQQYVKDLDPTIMN